MSEPKKSSPPVGKRMSFKAILEPWAEGMDYCAVAVPARITKAMGTAGPVLVMAKVNGSKPFQVSLFPVGGGRHFLRIKAKVRAETKTQTGDEVTIRFTVLDRADVTLPDDVRDALRDAGVLDAFQSFPPGKQNFTLRHINEAVKPETRARRVQKAVALAQLRKEERADDV